MEENAPSKSDHNMRRLARLAAVQGLYQMALMPEAAENLVRRFSANPGVLLQEDQTMIAVDTEMFGHIVSGVSNSLSNLDTMIAGALDAKLSADRLEPLLKAILRAGTFELLHNPEIQSGIIINDYVDVAHGFFGSKEPGLVNAVLDRLGKTLRS